jgi:predicted transcriptional regulator of viral defense system
MIKTTAMLMEEKGEYRYPANKIARMVSEGTLFPVVRGLYTTDREIPGHFLAASIYGPSYLSFDFALSYWGLIPEAVYVYSSATFDKKKKKQFKTEFGLFTYRDVPKKAYPLGIQIVKSGENVFLIADAEKALCDKLYTLSPVANQGALSELLFSNLRIDESELTLLDFNKMAYYARFYRTTNHKLLIKMIRKSS